MRNSAQQHVVIAHRRVDFRLVQSRSARKLRIRVGIDGVELVAPANQDPTTAHNFLSAHGQWVLDQIDRIERLRSMRRPRRRQSMILFRGEPTAVCVETRATYRGPNRVVNAGDSIQIIRGEKSTVSPARSLEKWLRQLARQEIAARLDDVTMKLRRKPNKVFVMGQRTKWGNCSALQNLSFNWRLILAPPFVSQYLVIHEAVHLAVPDHSRRFWLTVQSFCPATERAKRWLSANADRLLVNLHDVVR